MFERIKKFGVAHTNSLPDKIVSNTFTWYELSTWNVYYGYILYCIDSMDDEQSSKLIWEVQSF